MGFHISDDDKRSYHREGYLVLRQVYPRSAMEEIKLEYERLWLQKIMSGGIRQDPSLPMESLFPTMHEMNRTSGLLRRFMLNACNVGIAKELLGENVLIIGTTCFFKAPMTKSLPLHQDNIDNGCVPASNCAIWTSLDAADSENGGLCIMPRTHLLGLLSINAPNHELGLLSRPIPQIANKEVGGGFVHICTEPGDVIVFDGNTVHGSTGNITRHRFRRSFATHFCGESVHKVFANFNHLISEDGEVVSRKVNREHSKIRSYLLPEAKMKSGTKIY